MNIKNLTPHAIIVVDENKQEKTRFPSEGSVRLRTETKTVGEIVIGKVEIPLTATVFGEVEGLPEYDEGTILIVSSLVAQARPERSDLYIPNESVRDENGFIIGVRSLSPNPFKR